MSNKKCLLRAGLLSCLMSVAFNVNAVDVHINSGNPAYPFPQFLNYACGGNLGTKTPVGLVHAEMEKQIREAYQLHANEFDYTGDELNGIKYIYTKVGGPYDCTEGDGYALLAAAYMADKVTFDGYWMHTHDLRRVKTKKYLDCTDNHPDYQYGDFSMIDIDNSAADGDVDVALALYVAYKQWGEFMLDDNGEKVLDACGNPISYKQELINVLRGLVAISARFPDENPRRVNTGMIGLDGYPKNGNTWGEVSDWASDEDNYLSLSDGVKVFPDYQGGTNSFVDYHAPAYFREFYDLLVSLGDELGATNVWEAEQFHRAEASSDWIISQLLAKSELTIPVVGSISVNKDGSETSFSNYNLAEDFRTPWRNISNYVWHGNPSFSWNPVTHQVEDGANQFEYEAAVRLSNYMIDPAHWSDSTSCYSVPPIDKVSVSGVEDLSTSVNMYGTNDGDAFSIYSSISWLDGASSFAAIGTQNYDLMGDLYRKCYEYFDFSSDDGKKIPRYFHGWFRQLGMMALTGNYAAPSVMSPKSNLRMYVSVKDSVSYCHVGDTITYQISYRNYGSVSAKNISVRATLPDACRIIEVSNGGSFTPKMASWSIDSVSGLKSDASLVGPDLDFSATNLSKTIGTLTLRVKVLSAALKSRVIPTIVYSCDDNAIEESPSIYPNNVTATMQSNYIDVVDNHQLKIAKTANVDSVANGDIVKFSVAYTNDSIPWLTGGRPNVNVTLASDRDSSSSDKMLTVKMRMVNDAVEPAINYGNYRVSIYVTKEPRTTMSFDENYNIIYVPIVEEGLGMSFSPLLVEGIEEKDINQSVTQISDSLYRITFSFVPSLGYSTVYLSKCAGADLGIAPGKPLRCNVLLKYPDYCEFGIDKYWTKFDAADDESLYYPISPSWQDCSKTVSIDKAFKDQCEISDIVNETALVEEFDGYTWRKVLGNSPCPNGSIAENVVVRDTLPLGFEFISSSDTTVSFTAAPENANYAGIVTYKKNKMYVGATDTLNYTCRFVGSSASVVKSSSYIEDSAENATSSILELFVKDTTKTAVENVAADNSPVDVYNASGVRMKHEVSPDSAFDNLHRGVYVVGHKKALKLSK